MSRNFLRGSRIVLSRLPPCAKRRLGRAFDLNTQAARSAMRWFAQLVPGGRMVLQHG